MTVEVRPAGPADLATFVAVRNAVTPDWPTSLVDLAWESTTYAGGGRFIAELDGLPVGVANTGRIFVHGPAYPFWWTQITVLPQARRQGVGSGLLAAVSALARQAGKTGLHGPVRETEVDALDFLRRRGFSEHERSKTVRLELPGVAPEAPTVPEGIRLVTLADRPDLVAGVHAVALEAFADIPGGDPMEVGSLDEFRARDVDRPGMPAEAFVAAIEAATDTVVGYASLLIERGRPTVAIHDMTAVRRSWRGRGLAAALKVALVRWAVGARLEALETANDEDNAAMRSINARLGYRPLPDLLFMRGPLAAEVIGASSGIMTA